MGIYCHRWKELRLIPDHSASHCYPSDEVRKESAILFLDTRQMSLGGAQANKDTPPKRCKKYVAHFPQNMIIIAWSPF